MGLQTTRSQSKGKETKKNSDYVNNVGSLIEKKDGSFAITLNPNVEVLINGREVSTSADGKRYINLEDPIEGLERMLDKGIIDEEEYDRKVANTPDYVKYQLKVKLS